MMLHFFITSALLMGVFLEKRPYTHLGNHYFVEQTGEAVRGASAHSYYNMRDHRFKLEDLVEDPSYSSSSNQDVGDEIRFMYRNQESGIVASCAGVDSAHLPRDYVLQARVLADNYEIGRTVEREGEGDMNWALSLSLGATSCFVWDPIRSVLWLLADKAGVAPLWYGFKSTTTTTTTTTTDFVVTSDMITAYSAGFDGLTPVPAGQFVRVESKLLGSGGGGNVHGLHRTEEDTLSVTAVHFWHDVLTDARRRETKKKVVATTLSGSSSYRNPAAAAGAVSHLARKTGHNPVSYARRLYSTGVAALIKSSISARQQQQHRELLANRSYLVEISPADPSSRVLQCLLDSMKVQYTPFPSGPLVHSAEAREVFSRHRLNSSKEEQQQRQRQRQQDEAGSYSNDGRLRWAVEEARSITSRIDNIDGDDLGSMSLSQTRSVSDHTPRERAVARRALLCRRRAELGVTLISPLSGLFTASGHAPHGASALPSSYFNAAWQVFFCDHDTDTTITGTTSITGGSVVYPFANSAEFMESIHDTRLPSVQLASAVDTLVGMGVCLRDDHDHEDDGGSSSSVLDGRYFRDAVLAAVPASTNSPSGTHVVVVTATVEYLPMLGNWLRSVRRVVREYRGVERATSGGVSLPVLVLCGDEKVAALAQKFGAATLFAPPSSFEDAALGSVVGGDFGSVSYQQLMLARTRLVLTLLRSHLSPIVADIDTVWKSNPFLRLPAGDGNTASTHSSGGGDDDVVYDVAVTDDDNGEWCGCWVVLSNTEAALSLWGEVERQHAQLVRTAQSAGSVSMPSFLESEQKILTRLLPRTAMTPLYQQKQGHSPLSADSAELYSILLDSSTTGDDSYSVVVAVLPRASFPSGTAYFNSLARCGQGEGEEERGGDEQHISIVHNNYLIGRGPKMTRFRAAGLWDDDTKNKEEHDASYTFPVAVTARLPTLSISSPPHLSRSGVENHQLYVCSIDLPSCTNTKVPAADLFLHGADSDSSAASATRRELGWPLSVPVGSGFALLSLPNYQSSSSSRNSSTSTSNVKRGGTFIRRDSSIAAEVDVAPLGASCLSAACGSSTMDSVWGQDRGHCQDCYFCAEETVHAATAAAAARNQNVTGAAAAVSPAAADSVLSVTIVVLAFDRPQALTRLLDSLLKADYSSANGHPVSLHISVDGPRRANANGGHSSSGVEEEEEAEFLRVRQCGAIATALNWVHGPKKVTIRTANVGLAAQWLLAWDPPVPIRDSDQQQGEEEEEKERKDNVAIVLEDDTEVSPLFFKWATRRSASFLAYRTTINEEGERSALTQKQLHRRLLRACMDDMHHAAAASRGKEYKEDEEEGEALRAFREKYAGVPLGYGVCMQSQHLSPLFYPRRHHMTHEKGGYLYSLIGSWGPLLYAQPWQAFRAWLVRHLRGSLNGSDTDGGGGRDALPWVPGSITNGFFADSVRRNAAKSDNTFMETAPVNASDVHVSLMAMITLLPGRLWTPFHVRWAYESGAKCLYHPAPVQVKGKKQGGQQFHQLIVNHRDQGESYHEDNKGSTGVLLMPTHFSGNECGADSAALSTDVATARLLSMIKSLSLPEVTEKTQPLILQAVVSLLYPVWAASGAADCEKLRQWYFDSDESMWLSELHRRQFDLSGRRAGSLASDGVIPFIATALLHDDAASNILRKEIIIHATTAATAVFAASAGRDVKPETLTQLLIGAISWLDHILSPSFHSSQVQFMCSKTESSCASAKVMDAVLSSIGIIMTSGDSSYTVEAEGALVYQTPSLLDNRAIEELAGLLLQRQRSSVTAREELAWPEALLVLVHNDAVGAPTALLLPCNNRDEDTWCRQLYFQQTSLSVEGKQSDPGAVLYRRGGRYQYPTRSVEAPVAALFQRYVLGVATEGEATSKTNDHNKEGEMWVISRRIEGELVERRTAYAKPQALFE